MTDKDFSKLLDFIKFGKCYIPLDADTEEYMQQISANLNLHESEYCLVPKSENSVSKMENSADGEQLYFEECEARDLKFHSQYFLFLGFIWEQMPNNFKRFISKENFYLFLKGLKKNYRVLYSFKDEEKKQQIYDILKERKKEFRLTYKSIRIISELFGKSELIEYDSISFGRMSQATFEEYIKQQVPWIYSEVIAKFYKDKEFDEKIETIEHEFRKFLSKL